MLARYVTAIVLAAVLAAPAAAADHVHEVEEVETEETDEYDTLYLVVEAHPDPEYDVGGLYYDFLCPFIEGICIDGRYKTEANVQLWEESNGCDGLQEQSVDCDPDRAGNEDADTHHETVGCVRSTTLCGSPVWPTP